MILLTDPMLVLIRLLRPQQGRPLTDELWPYDIRRSGFDAPWDERVLWMCLSCQCAFWPTHYRNTLTPGRLEPRDGCNECDCHDIDDTYEMIDPKDIAAYELRQAHNKRLQDLRELHQATAR